MSQNGAFQFYIVESLQEHISCLSVSSTQTKHTEMGLAVQIRWSWHNKWTALEVGYFPNCYSLEVGNEPYSLLF